MAIANTTKFASDAWSFMKFLTVGEGQMIAARIGFEAPLLQMPELQKVYMSGVTVPERDGRSNHGEHQARDAPVPG